MEIGNTSSHWKGLPRAWLCRTLCFSVRSVVQHILLWPSLRQGYIKLSNVLVSLVIRSKDTQTDGTSRGLEVPREHTTRCTLHSIGYSTGSEPKREGRGAGARLCPVGRLAGYLQEHPQSSPTAACQCLRFHIGVFKSFRLSRLPASHTHCPQARNKELKKQRPNVQNMRTMLMMTALLFADGQAMLWSARS